MGSAWSAKSERYNQDMARGWESKPVGAQIEESNSEPSRNEPRCSSAAEAQNHRKRADLMLSRGRILQQLERSRNER